MVYFVLGLLFFCNTPVIMLRCACQGATVKRLIAQRRARGGAGGQGADGGDGEDAGRVLAEEREVTEPVVILVAALVGLCVFPLVTR